MINKIKFQNPNFRKKLQDARGYKRIAKNIPQTKWGMFFGKIGLSSLRYKIYAGLVLVLAIYFFYVPNLFSVKTVQISGVNEAESESVEKTARDYLAVRFPWSQSNLVLLSKKRLSDYLLKKSGYVSQIVQIGKDFPNTLKVAVSGRYDQFLMQTPASAYIVSNDGLVTKQLSSQEVYASSSEPSPLLPLILKREEIFYENQKAFEGWYIQNLNAFMALLRTQLNSETKSIILENTESPEVEIKTQYGWSWYFDINSDINKTVSQGALLLKDIGQARIHSIKYIDMRINDKGFVCYLDAECAREPQPVQATTKPTK